MFFFLIFLNVLFSEMKPSPTYPTFITGDNVINEMRPRPTRPTFSPGPTRPRPTFSPAPTRPSITFVSTTRFWIYFILFFYFNLTLVKGQHPVWRQEYTLWCIQHRDQQQQQPCRPAPPTLGLQHTNQPTSPASISPQHRCRHFPQRDHQLLNPPREAPTNLHSSQLS